MSSSNPFDGIFEAYTSLTSRLLAFTLFLLCTLSVISLYCNTDGPFELIAKGLENYIDSADAIPLLKTLATFLLNIINIVLKYKPSSYYFGLLLVTVIVFNSFSVILSAFFIFLFLQYSTKTSVVSAYIITQLFYIYNYITYGWQRVLLITIAVVVYFIGVNEFLKMMNYSSIH